MRQATTITVHFEGAAPAVVTRFGEKDDCPSLFQCGGKMFAGNLWKMHETHGIPLEVSFAECRRRGWIPGLEQTRIDAKVSLMRSGVAADEADRRARRMIQEANADAKVMNP